MTLLKKNEKNDSLTAWHGGLFGSGGLFVKMGFGGGGLFGRGGGYSRVGAYSIIYGITTISKLKKDVFTKQSLQHGSISNLIKLSQGTSAKFATIHCKKRNVMLLAKLKKLSRSLMRKKSPECSMWLDTFSRNVAIMILW